jgi:hypothetical protein
VADVEPGYISHDTKTAPELTVQPRPELTRRLNTTALHPELMTADRIGRKGVINNRHIKRGRRL